MLHDITIYYDPADIIGFKVKKPNRKNARKSKQGCGCKMCKPHKGKYAHKFRKKDRIKMS